MTMTNNDWPEGRMDIIGQNGPTGEHYEAAEELELLRRERDLLKQRLAAAAELAKSENRCHKKAMQGWREEEALRRKAQAERDELKALCSNMAGFIDAIHTHASILCNDAYQNGYQVCCGRGREECCGEPDCEWSQEDQATMNAWSPVVEFAAALLCRASQMQIGIDETHLQLPTDTKAAEPEVPVKKQPRDDDYIPY